MEASSFRETNEKEDFVDLTDENKQAHPERSLQLVERPHISINITGEAKSAASLKVEPSRSALQPMNHGVRQQKPIMPSTTAQTSRSTPPRHNRLVNVNVNSNSSSSALSLTRASSYDEPKHRPKIPKKPASISSPSMQRQFSGNGNTRPMPSNQSQRSFKSFNSSHASHTSNLPTKTESPNSQKQEQQHQNRKGWHWANRLGPALQEQALFEQRLCEDAYGVAVRKIGPNGKSQLRYVKCVPLENLDYDDAQSLTGKSVSSIVRTLRGRRSPSSQSDLEKDPGQPNKTTQGKKALTWGKKKEHKLALDRFVCVRKGKTTERTKRNSQPPTRLLSLITTEKDNSSLDIEAPTRLDRDKFARAFARFLQVPLEDDDKKQIMINFERVSASHSAPDLDGMTKRTVESRRAGTSSSVGAKGFVGSSLSMLASQNAALADNMFNQVLPTPPTKEREFIKGGAIVSEFSPDDHKPIEEGSIVSSLTGAAYDQEIVEELHQALTELRGELETSRAEAARAVKVAEQAIQSAENSSSRDWNSTVTHKAAEAAALAQKKSAEAMAKARLAEERLSGERKTASFWRKQAEAAEEEAGMLQTRAAAAEVQRATMAEELVTERKRSSEIVSALQNRFSEIEEQQREAYETVIQRTRELEVELDGTRRDLCVKSQEAKTLKDDLTTTAADTRGSAVSKFSLMGKKKIVATEKVALLNSESSSSQDHDLNLALVDSNKKFSNEDVLKIHAEFSAVKLQFELLKRSTTDEFDGIPAVSAFWTKQATKAISHSQSEILTLRERLALEAATRRRLLNEVQDLRGNIRVYCRPKPSNSDDRLLEIPSNEVLLLQRGKISQDNVQPLSFEYDHVFGSNAGQKEVYSEVEELVLSVLDGFNICMIVYGPSECGKTYTMLGDINYPSKDNNEIELGDFGLHLQGVQQLFTVSDRRSERYQDSFSLSIVEVHDEKVHDVVAGTTVGDAKGVVDMDIQKLFDRKKPRRKRPQCEGDSVPGNSTTSRSGRSAKLEIRTNSDGETIVQGLVSVQVASLEEVIDVWKQALTARAMRLNELGIDSDTYEASSHMIATLQVVSRNVATGVGSVGKIQFVDLAGADLIGSQSSSKKSRSSSVVDGVLAPVGNNKEWRFAQKSISTLGEVFQARSQFSRAVPYRNSTLTHLLSDSLEGDTKVMVMVCVSSDPHDAQETASTLRFGTKAKRVNIGKATKHALH